MTLWRETNGFDDKYGDFMAVTPLKIFSEMFYNKLHIELNNPNSRNIRGVSLEQLLLDDEIFTEFNSGYWNQSYNYEDLYKILLIMSIKIGYELPEEIVNIILCYGFQQHNKLFLISEKELNML